MSAGLNSWQIVESRVRIIPLISNFKTDYIVRGLLSLLTRFLGDGCNAISLIRRVADPVRPEICPIDF